MGVFFRKKGKYTDVEGYNRISRLIEDRQREIGDHAEPEDDFDDDSVLLTREPTPRDRPALRMADDTPAPSAVRPIPLSTDDVTPVVTTPTSNTSASIADERRVPFNPTPAAPTPSTPPSTSASPAMVVPDLGAASPDGCLVAAEATWEGKLVTSGNVRVEGTFRGDVETPATLFVAANAHLIGTVRAKSIVLAGEIEGRVNCSDRLEILPGGSARGEVETVTLVIHEGAFIDSRFQMHKAGAPALG